MDRPTLTENTNAGDELLFSLSDITEKYLDEIEKYGDCDLSISLGYMDKVFHSVMRQLYGNNISDYINEKVK
jgi:hypothetical protein